MQSARPLITSVSASDTPFVGMLMTSMPAEKRKRSKFMCVALPVPAFEQMMPPCFFFAAATRSATLL